MATLVGDQLTAATAQARSKNSHVVFRSPRYTFTLTGALTDDDVIQMAPVLPGQTVIDTILESTDLDTGTPTAVFDVGDGDDPNRYVADSAIAGTGGLVRKNTLTAPRTYDVADTIDVVIKSQATAATSGTIALTLLYTDTRDRREGA